MSHQTLYPDRNIGGGLGQSSFDDDGGFDGLDVDDSDTSYQLYGGYKFLRYFSVEGRYNNFGTVTISEPGFGSAGVDVSSLTANAVGIIPFGVSGFEGFGMVAFGTTKLSVDDGEGGVDENYSTVGFGLGVRYHFTEMMSVGLQHERYAFEVDDLGPSFTPASSSTNVFFQLTF